MTVLRNVNLATENSVFRDDVTMEDREMVSSKPLYFLFYDKHEKLVYAEASKYTLVMDARAGKFFVHRHELLQLEGERARDATPRIVARGEEIFAVVQQRTVEKFDEEDDINDHDDRDTYTEWIELRRLKFEGSKLVEAGVAWKSAEADHRAEYYLGIHRITSAVFVDGVELE